MESLCRERRGAPIFLTNRIVRRTGLRARSGESRAAQSSFHRGRPLGVALSTGRKLRFSLWLTWRTSCMDQSHAKATLGTTATRPHQGRRSIVLASRLTSMSST
ncbi:protein of unknown function (plasmid) [Cupriavidus taiwanensis]|uniref:Uncharacterized protein n=1 Tax=Cupriavidus taiwanensis TaxID=164546 RepID=A0A375EBJ3_9BURK|nr:protein of unknown function [Cupriavidus taiwanensis]